MAKGGDEPEKTKYQLLYPGQQAAAPTSHLRMSSSHEHYATPLLYAAAKSKNVCFGGERRESGSTLKTHSGKRTDQLKQSFKSYKSLNCSFFRS